jgi:fatty-acyl-CoA synthase
MTETSPVGTNGRLKGKHHDAPIEKQYELATTQGRANFGVELKIVDAEGRALAHDGMTAGELLVRGPWVASAYYGDEAASRASHDSEGWMRTGDVGTIDADGYLRLTDRIKDLIKSGGEWISSIELENAAMNHPGVAEAAAIGIPDPRWSERPILVVVRKKDAALGAAELAAFLKDKVAKWWLPDDVVFVDELPHTGTGKVNKRELRERYRTHKPQAADQR